MLLGGVAVRKFLVALIVVFLSTSQLAAEVQKFARFQAGETVAYGLVEGDRIRQLVGDLFGNWQATDKTFALKEVQLLVPTQPTQVLALAGNYENHINKGLTTTTI